MIKNYFQVPLPIDFDPKKEDEQKKLIPYKKMGDRISWIKKIFRCLKYFFTHLIHARRKKRKKEFLTSDDDESLDWWTKYFASLEVSVMIKYPLEISRNCENCGRFFPGGKKKGAERYSTTRTEGHSDVQGILFAFSEFSPAQVSHWAGNRYTTENWRCSRNSPASRIVWERSSCGRGGKARIPTTTARITLENSRFAQSQFFPSLLDSFVLLLSKYFTRRDSMEEFCILKRSIKEKCLNVCSNELLIGGKSTSGGKKRFLVNDWKIISKGNSFFFFIFFLNLIIKEWTWNNSDWIRVSFRKFHFKLRFLSSLRPRRINEMTNPLIKVHRQGRICVYRWPHPSNLPCKTRSGRSASDGLCDDYPHSESIKLVVRLYVVKGARYIFDSSCDDEAHGIESIPQASTCNLRIP